MNLLVDPDVILSAEITTFIYLFTFASYLQYDLSWIEFIDTSFKLAKDATGKFHFIPVDFVESAVNTSPSFPTPNFCTYNPLCTNISAFVFKILFTNLFVKPSNRQTRNKIVSRI